MNTSLRELLKNSDLIVNLYDFIQELYYKHFISDVGLIKKRFKESVGREVELNNPIRFTDKQQWLKLNWYDPLAVKCADKYAVREFIKERIGQKYLNDLYGIYESVNDIDIDKLPNAFVLKGTHGSGFNIICKDKTQMNWHEEFKKIKRWLKKNYYWQNREWVYKNIKPRIVCEKYLTEENYYNSLTDYKIYCFNGIPKYCQVIRGRGVNETIDFYDTEWGHMPFTGLRPLTMSDKNYTKPKKYEKMLDLAKRLSENFPFVRVDFYYIKDKIYFGELTFFPLSGIGRFEPPEWDLIVGNLLQLQKLDKSG